MASSRRMKIGSTSLIISKTQIRTTGELYLHAQSRTAIIKNLKASSEHLNAGEALENKRPSCHYRWE